jgi:hypothetical protein
MDPQLLHQDICSGRHENAELIGQEARATGAIDLQIALQLLDPVFNLTSLAVDVSIDPPRTLAKVGYNEAGVVLWLAAGMANDLGLDDDAALAGPPLGGIETLSVEVLGLATLTSQTTGLAHELTGEPRENAVSCEAHGVVDASFFIEEVEDLWVGESSIESDENASVGKGLTQMGYHAAEHCQDPQAIRCVSRSQQSGEEVMLGLVVKAEKAEQRQVTPSIVVTVKEAELLGSMGGVVGRVEIEDDLATAPTQPLPVSIEDDPDESLPHPVKVASRYRVFKPGDGRLRAQRRTLDGIPIEDHLIDRIVSKAGSIVGVGIATGDAKDPLGKKLSDFVFDTAGTTSIDNRAGKLVDQSQPLVCCLEEHGPAIGAGVGEVKPGGQRAIK